MTFTENDLIAYLQRLVNELYIDEKRYGIDEFTESLINSITACKDMIETLTEKSVTIQKNGRVTTE